MRARHWARLAAQAGLEPDAVVARVGAMREALIAAAAATARATEVEPVRRLAELVRDRLARAA